MVLQEKEKIIEDVINKISNIHKTKKEFIKNIVIEKEIPLNNKQKLKEYISQKILGINKSLNRFCKEYWIKRGWNEEDTEIIIQNIKKKMGPRLSPFSKEYWIEKGYSEEESIYIANSKRPIRKEYWIEKGYSEEESIKKALETKKENNKKGGISNKNKPKKELRKSSVRCIEYWLKKGYSLQESKEHVRNIQSFNLEKCIKKYGDKEGKKFWEERQKRWQKTINSKSEIEIEKINKKKNAINLKNFENTNDCIKKLKETRNMKLFDNVEDFIHHFQNIVLKNNPYIAYWPLTKILEEKISKIQKQLIPVEEIINAIKPLIKDDEIYLYTKSKKQAYRKWEGDSLLRSSYEIYFFENFRKKFKDRKILIDNQYPNSNFRYDFFIDNTYYIEICPSFFDNEKYRKKMLQKQKTFGCILLKTIEEIDHFIEKL